MTQGLVERPEYAYIRHGTQCLIANFHVANWEVIAPSIGATRTEEDFAAHIPTVSPLLTPVASTYCIPSNDSARVLSYQELPTSIQCGEAMARRRKEDRRAGIASRGMVRRWGRFSSRVCHRGVPDRDRVPDRCNSRTCKVRGRTADQVNSLISHF